MGVVVDVCRRVGFDTVFDYVLYVLAGSGVYEIAEQDMRKILAEVLEKLSDNGYCVVDDFNSSLISEQYLEALDALTLAGVVAIHYDPVHGCVLKIDKNKLEQYFAKLHPSTDTDMLSTIRRILADAGVLSLNT